MRTDLLELETTLRNKMEAEGHSTQTVEEKKEVEIKLITNDLYVGKVFWQDPNCICLFGQYDSPILIWRQSIVYLKAKN